MRRRWSLLITGIIMDVTVATIVIMLVIFKNAFATFVVYYLLLCLTMPVTYLLLVKKTNLKGFLEYIGLHPKCPRAGYLTGLISGLLFFIVIVSGFFLFYDQLLTGSDIAEAVGGWGITREMLIPVVLIMLVFNGAAEELFWRGFIFHRLEKFRSPRLTIFASAVFYSSYHVLTLVALVGNVFLAVLFLLCIFGAGCFWGWTRYKFVSVLPAVMSHMLATAGYLIVYVAIVY